MPDLTADTCEVIEACPFCGGEPELYPQRTSTNALSHYYVVWCRGKCHAIGPERRTEEEAIAAWNHRQAHTPDDAVERVARALESLLKCFNDQGYHLAALVRGNPNQVEDVAEARAAIAAMRSQT